MVEINDGVDSRRDHDLLIEIKTTVVDILRRMDTFAPKVELVAFQEREKACREGLKELVRRDEFLPIRNIVYGGVGLICLTVLGAVLALVVLQK
jgi:hypothetical protein